MDLKLTLSPEWCCSVWADDCKRDEDNESEASYSTAIWLKTLFEHNKQTLTCEWANKQMDYYLSDGQANMTRTNWLHNEQVWVERELHTCERLFAIETRRFRRKLEQ